MKVLIIEDNIMNLKLFSDTLRLKGYEVAVARNGIEALEILKTFIPDLILLDLYMPGMSGFRFANYISKENKYSSIPMIVISASSSIYDVKEMASYNVKAYLVKPVSPTKLLETVKNVILMSEGENKIHQIRDEYELDKTSDTRKISSTEKNTAKGRDKIILETGIAVQVENLIEGMVLGAPVTKDKTVIYPEGAKLSEKMIEKIKALGIKEVYVSQESYEKMKNSMFDGLLTEEDTKIDDILRE